MGHILSDSGVPVVEPQPSTIIGPGSLGFEFVRGLVERLPIHQRPGGYERPRSPSRRKTSSNTSFVRSLDLPDDRTGIHEIGGADRASYDDIIREYAGQRRVRCLIIPIPRHIRYGYPGTGTHWLRLSHEDKNFDATHWSDALVDTINRFPARGKPRQEPHALLFAEMRLPGRAWLFFEVGPSPKVAEVCMTGVFDPVGLWGRVYWYMVNPLRVLAFNGLFRGNVKSIEQD